MYFVFMYILIVPVNSDVLTKVLLETLNAISLPPQSIQEIQTFTKTTDYQYQGNSHHKQNIEKLTKEMKSQSQRLQLQIQEMSNQDQNQRSPVVKTTQGWVQGIIADDGPYYAYYGIHYAGNASGENRFKAPTSPPAYNSIFSAVDKDIRCPQPGPLKPIGEEDCLRLSIFTENPAPVYKTVLVFIDGEDFTTSDPFKYSFKNLVEQDLVVVAVSYRVSIFGFLCLRTEEVPGNAGLKDVLKALEWIHYNIDVFGGDPNNVVLFGHGSGAAVVDYITLSKSSYGLVNKAIAISGSALASWALTRDPIAQAFEFSTNLATKFKNVPELTKVLKKLHKDILLLAQHNFEQELTNAVAFAPCIEDSKLSGSFLDVAPIMLFNNKDYIRVFPFIYGYSDKEGSIKANLKNKEWPNAMEQRFSDFLPSDLRLTKDHHLAIKNFYFANGAINQNRLEEYLNYFGDTWIVQPLINCVKRRINISLEKIYLFEFTYRGLCGHAWNNSKLPLAGVPHGQILNYILGIGLTKNDAGISNDIVRRIASFAKTGNPNYENSVPWYPLTNYSLNYITYFGGNGDESDSECYWGIYPASQPRLAMRSLWEPLYHGRYLDAMTSSASVLPLHMFSILIMLSIVFLDYLIGI